MMNLKKEKKLKIRKATESLFNDTKLMEDRLKLMKTYIKAEKKKLKSKKNLIDKKTKIPYFNDYEKKQKKKFSISYKKRKIKNILRKSKEKEKKIENENNIFQNLKNKIDKEKNDFELILKQSNCEKYKKQFLKKKIKTITELNSLNIEDFNEMYIRSKDQKNIKKNISKFYNLNNFESEERKNISIQTEEKFNFVKEKKINFGNFNKMKKVENLEDLGDKFFSMEIFGENKIENEVYIQTVDFDKIEKKNLNFKKTDFQKFKPKSIENNLGKSICYNCFKNFETKFGVYFEKYIFCKNKCFNTYVNKKIEHEKQLVRKINEIEKSNFEKENNFGNETNFVQNDMIKSIVDLNDEFEIDYLIDN